MKKFLSLIIALAMVASMLCMAVPALAEPITITYWVNDRHDSEYMTAIIEKFNKENTDNIYLDMQIITDDFENMITLAYSGNTAPDIIGDSITLKNFVNNGMLLPLNDYIAADPEYQKVNEPYTHTFEGLNVVGDQIYYVFTGMRSGVRVIYNKELLAASGYDSIPATLDEYIAMAKKMTEDGNYQTYGIGFTSSNPMGRLLERVASVSGLSYYDYVNGKFDFSGYKPILEKGRELVAVAYPDQLGVDNMRALFAAGEFALWSNGSQEAGVFTSQLPITDFEWGVAPIPTLTGEIKGALPTTPAKGYAIMSTCKNPDAAWKVIQYLQSEEVIKGYLENGYILPITTYMDNIIDKTKIGRMADFSLLPYESVYPTVPTINLTGDNYRTVMWNAINGFVDIDEAIEDLNTRYNAALEADVASGATLRLVVENYDPLNPSAGNATYLSE